MIDADAIKMRILSMMEQLGMTPSAFADRAGISRSALTHITSGRNKVTLDMINKIVQGFDEWSAEWIIFGKGPQQSDKTAFENDLFSYSSVPEQELHTRTKDNCGIQSPSGRLEPEIKIVQMPAKQIERITVFYTDGSYQEFRSNKE